MSEPVSLKEKLVAATTKAEISALVKEGATYGYASRHTKNQWKRLVEKCLAKLDGKHTVKNTQAVATSPAVAKLTKAQRKEKELMASVR